MHAAMRQLLRSRAPRILQTRQASTAGNWKTFSIYRWDPDTGAKPKQETQKEAATATVQGQAGFGHPQ